jgi:hypothetical protein
LFIAFSRFMTLHFRDSLSIIHLSVHLFILFYSLFCQIFSLWTVSPQRLGGLNFGTNDVGNVLAVSGTSLTILNLYIFSNVRRSFSFLTSKISTTKGCTLLCWSVTCRLFRYGYYNVSAWLIPISAKNLWTYCPWSNRSG